MVRKGVKEIDDCRNCNRPEGCHCKGCGACNPPDACSFSCEVNEPANPRLVKQLDEEW